VKQVSEGQSQKVTDAILDKIAPVYGAVVFGIPATRQVSDRFGRVSCVMLDVRVPVLGTGWSVKAAIYANLERKADGASVVPSAYVPAKFIVPDAEGAVDALKAHIENAAERWPGYDAALDAAAAALLGKTDAKNAPVSPVKRPALARLIGTDGKLVATAPLASA
jgi:hypothetical protein